VTTESIAWIGTGFIILHGMPQLLLCLKAGTASGTSLWFLLFWWLGATCTIPYVLVTQNYPVLAAHSFNFCIITAILGLKCRDYIRSKASIKEALQSQLYRNNSILNSNHKITITRSDFTNKQTKL